MMTWSLTALLMAFRQVTTTRVALKACTAALAFANHQTNEAFCSHNYILIGLHGFHIHEFGDLSQGVVSIEEHF